MVWNAANPASSAALASDVIRANWDAIAAMVGIAPSSSTAMILPKQPTFVFGGSTVAIPIIGVKYVSIATVGNSTASTSDLMTLSLDAGSLSATPRWIMPIGWGDMAANANNKVVKLLFGNTTVVQRTHTQNGGNWFSVGIVVANTTAAQVSYGQMWNVDGAAAQVAASNDATPAEATSAAITVKWTGHSSAGVSNDVRQLGAIILAG